MSAWLLPIADREPLRWIVAEQRTAFGARHQQEAARLRPGDTLLLYTTRGCFHNPTRDRGRIAGRAEIRTVVQELPEPVRFDAREFPLGVEFRIDLLAKPREGVALADVVQGLTASFPNSDAWSAYLRRALVPLDDHDAEVLADLLAPIARPYTDVAEEYAAL